jgi:methylated-DNA-[protein]-cysteine S-methyltransferase
MDKHFVYHYQAPLCSIELIASSSSLLKASCLLAAEKKEQDENPVIREAINQLSEYFAGKRMSFQLPLSYDSYTTFQRDVWQALSEIPYGQTRSYQQIALDLGNPKALRAVGNTCGRNPFLIFIPCHRVVRKNGSLGGFSAGLTLKSSLLNFEESRIGGGELR